MKCGQIMAEFTFYTTEHEVKDIQIKKFNILYCENYELGFGKLCSLCTSLRMCKICDCIIMTLKTGKS